MADPVPEYVHALLAAMLAAGPKLGVDVRRHRYQLEQLLNRPFFANIVSLTEDATKFPERAADIQVEIDDQLRLAVFLIHQVATHVDEELRVAGLARSELAKGIVTATAGILMGSAA